MINQKIVISFFTLFFSLHLSSAVLMTGDADAPEGATFSFAIKNNLISPFSAFYVAANEAVTTNKEFAISRLNRGATAFEPIAPAIVTLNGKADQNNPLFGAQNNALGLLRPAGSTDLLVAVTNDNPAVVYLVQNTFNVKNMMLVS